MLFVINTFRDEDLVARLLAQLIRHYPSADRLIVPDEPRLKNVQTGAWTHRYLSMALNFPEPSPTNPLSPSTFIKIDPDTCVWKNIKVPDAAWFGQLSPDRSFVFGGACGFSRKTAQRLVASGLLLENSQFTYQWKGEMVSCQDLIVAKAMKQLGIKPTRWPDVLNYEQADFESETKRIRGITHPHPLSPAQ